MPITKIGVTLLIVGLVVGVVAGYGTGFTVYQPQISQLESDISTLQSSITALNSTLQKRSGGTERGTGKCNVSADTVGRYSSTVG